jgi:uncharacterized protein (TIGR02145 family)
MIKIALIFLILICLLLFSSCGKESQPPLYIEGSGVVDAEGNSYKTVIIGNQEWMAENLKSNLFCSGDSIPNSGDSTQLRVYNDDLQNEPVYGKLYNYQAVVDTLGLCPCGWHVPTELDYAKLINYLGGHEKAMKSMKSIGFLEHGTGLWREQKPWSLYSGTNTSGFNALPGGFAQVSPLLTNYYFEKDTIAVFWAIPETDQYPIIYTIRTPQVEKMILKSNPLFKRVLYYSVRCIKTYP